jgi:thiol-disulfide isomerase/thioredoxin
MNTSLAEIETEAIAANQYIDSLEQPFRQKFLARKQTYALNREAIDQLRKLAGKYAIVAFSAQWCKDCAANIPVLALISEATGLEVRVFGGLKKDPLSHTKKWRIPPSPPEVEKFNVDKIPLIMIFEGNGKEIGRIVENSTQAPTLEEEICRIIKAQSS